MQDLSEGIFINMANLTLAHSNSYYLRAGIKQDTSTALRNAPLHMNSLFPDHLLVKTEEISNYEERRSTTSSPKKPGCYHPFAPTAKQSQDSDRKCSVLAWKQINHRQQSKKVHDKASTYQQKLTMGQNYYK